MDVSVPERNPSHGSWQVVRCRRASFDHGVPKIRASAQSRAASPAGRRARIFLAGRSGVLRGR